MTAATVGKKKFVITEDLKLAFVHNVEGDSVEKVTGKFSEEGITKVTVIIEHTDRSQTIIDAIDWNTELLDIEEEETV